MRFHFYQSFRFLAFVLMGTSGFSFLSAAPFGPFSLTVGQEWSEAAPSVASGGSDFRVKSGPVGLHVIPNNGGLSFRPTSNQVGSHSVEVEYTDPSQTTRFLNTTITVAASEVSDPNGLYVVPGGGLDEEDAGTASNPFDSIEYAATQAAPGNKIYVRGGRYQLDDKITAQGTSSKPITIKPLPGERVSFWFDSIFGFNIAEESRYIIIEGFEIDGQTDAIDHWELLSKGFWRKFDLQDGGGTAIHIRGQHITIRNNVIHDTFQKGVNTDFGRYITVKNNVIYHIGHASLSGGHGIMRKWEYNFGNDDPDDSDLYRFDILGNMLFGIEQRVYSWVTTKGYCNMVLDEGKSILIDRTTDDNLKARIAHNIVAFGSIDHIRIKRTPNLEVHNNSIFTNAQQSHADGITEKEQMPNLVVRNNAVMAFSQQNAIDLNETFVKETDYGDRLKRNYVAGGGRILPDLIGVTDLGSTVSIFTDPENGDFSLRSHTTVPSYVGISDNHRTVLEDLVSTWGIKVKATGWTHDHLRNTQTILDNIPTDRFSFVSYGDSVKEKDNGRKAMFYNVIDDDWAAETGKDKLELILPDEYVQWYEANNQRPYGTRTIGGDYTFSGGADHQFDLGGSTINSEYNSLTVDGVATLQGDLVVELINGFIPVAGTEFTIISADSIQGIFKSIDLPELPSGLSWSAELSNDAFKLVVREDADPVALRVRLDTDRNFVLTFTTRDSETYQIQSSTDLVIWENQALIDGTGEMVDWTYLTSQVSKKYFRVIEQ